MNRRVLALALAAVLLTSALSPAARAGETQPFSAVRTYQEQFTDVRDSDWYYESVKALYELGLTNGQGSEARFAPDDDMTVAEALTVAARLRSLYEYKDCEAGPAQYAGGDIWYAPYAAYLRAAEVIGPEFEGLYGQKATRGQMAHILANTLPEALFEPINGDVVAAGFANGTYIRDVREDMPYCQDILTLYEWGILSGMDHVGTFRPEGTIPRCQMAAMVVRLAYSERRLTLPWDYASAYSREGTALSELVFSDGTFYEAPDPENREEIEADLRYMLSRGERKISLSYPPNTLNKSMSNALMQAFLDTARYYVEQTYNQVKCTYSTKSGTMVLSFSCSLYDDDQIDRYRDATMAFAIRVHDEMWAGGTITPDMTEYDKARAYFTWLCENCSYDFASTESSMSHSGYRAFAEGVAVCDGYTAAYNLLLKLEGISCSTVSTTDHIWTVAELDGTTVHIDTTWGDQTGTIAYRFFAMTEADAMARFS